MGLFTRSAHKNNDDGPDKWKDKYLNLLDAHEQLEKSHQEEHELLCKIIIRLSLVTAEVHPQLEFYQQRTRDYLKSGVNSLQLKADLQNLTKILYQIEKSSPKEQSSIVDLSHLLDFLLQRYTSIHQQNALTRLRKSSQYLDDPQRFFSAIVEIIESDPIDTSIIQQSRENQSSTLRTIDSSIVIAQLLKLLEKIEVPNAFIEKARNVKQQLKTYEASHSLESVLDSVISLLLEIHADKRPKPEEINKFLAQIAEQLTTLRLAFADSSHAFKDAGMSRINFDQSVSEQMSDLQYQSLHATQLESLQKVIASHIDKITREIQENRKKEAIELEKFQQHMEKLNQKIKTMEEETGELKSKLVAVSSQALSDALTGLPNRLAYDERLKYEISHWQRYHSPLCLLVWDIDFFKKINDKFGHQLGDKVLVHVARQFSENIRKTDFVARVGGEEFVMLMPNTQKLSAFQKAEDLRGLIEQNQLNLNNMAQRITVSCGITEFIKEDTYELAFARADRALYQAKKRGRNRCTMG
jgi:diguanylate cyclase